MSSLLLFLGALALPPAPVDPPRRLHVPASPQGGAGTLEVRFLPDARVYAVSPGLRLEPFGTLR